jgi:hypothetical protein
MNWRGVVKLTAGIAAVAWQKGVEDPKLQLDLARELMGHSDPRSQKE